MRCRVFIRGIPCSVNPKVLREALEEATDGCGEVLLLRDPNTPNMNRSYALASYESFSHALEACRKSVVIFDVVLTLNVVDRPKTWQTDVESPYNRRVVSNFEFIYKPTIEIEGDVVPKNLLSHTYGLQQALRSYCIPKWCHWTARGLDCELGEQCNFIHRKDTQSTTYPRKRPRELELSILPHQIIRLFTTTHFGDQPKWEYLELSEVLSGNNDPILSKVCTMNNAFVLCLATYLPVDAYLKQLSDKQEHALRSSIDAAIERSSGLQSNYTAKMNTAIITLLNSLGQWLKSTSVEEAFEKLKVSHVHRFAVQDPGAVLLIRPWYPLTPGCDLDVWINRGAVVKITQAYQNLCVPMLLRYEQNIISSVLEYVTNLFSVLSLSESRVVTRLGLQIVEQANGSVNVKCQALRMATEIDKPNFSQNLSSSLFDICLKPNAKLLAELPQDWIDFVSRNCVN